MRVAGWRRRALGGSPAVIGSCSRQATGACVHGRGGGRRLGARRRGGGRRGRGAGRVGGGSGGADGAAGGTGRDGRGGGGGGQRVAMEGVVDPVACPMGDTRRPSDGRSPRGRGPVVGRARGGGEERRSCTSYNAGGCCAHRTPHYTALAREPTHIHMQFLTRMQDADRTPPLKGLHAPMGRIRRCHGVGADYLPLPRHAHRTSTHSLREHQLASVE